MNIRWHCIYIRLVALLAMFMFIGLEILISVNSKTASSPTTKVEKCFRVEIGIQGGDEDPEIEAISFHCLKVKKQQFTYRIGNYSHLTDRVQCNSEPAYQYEIKKTEKLPMIVGKRVCWQKRCSTVVVQERQVLISEPFRKSFLEMEDKQNMTIDFARTTVNFDPSGLIDHFAENLAESFQQDIFDEHDLRRRTFLGGKNASCIFVGKEEETTSISTWVVVFTSSVWSVSMVLFFCMIITKRGVFYNMHNTWDWARKTYQMRHEFRGQKMYVKMATISGVNRFYVVDDYNAQVESEHDAEIDDMADMLEKDG